MRVNVGIRRRLAPLLDNNRRRIELLNSLLFSFPGTPILYYGDEIGMGDNIYLGDRNGVRTPMQWTPDRNAGFSTAVPAKLYFPVIMDPIWGYQAINVEAQLSDQSSLLHWTRNMIALRKLFKVFGRGTQEFLNPENRKVLAYLREYSSDQEGISETVLCVANLSRFAQPVSLDLSRFSGMVPVEMLGYVSFPQITSAPYPLTLAPYSFLWLELQPAPEAVEVSSVQSTESTLELTIDSAGNPWRDLLTGRGLSLLEQLLPEYLQRQRWFGAKSRIISSVRVMDWAELPGITAALVLLEVTYAEDPPDQYQLPLALSHGQEAESIRAAVPGAVLGSLMTGDGSAILHDAVYQEDFRQALLNLIASEAQITASQVSGDAVVPVTLKGHRSSALDFARGAEALAARTGSAEQSNTSILYEDKLILKLFRRIQSGENPDTEIGRFLTEVARFPRIAPFLGDIREQSLPDSEPTTLAMLQGLVENEGDGWRFTLDELARFFEGVLTCPPPSDVGVAPSFFDSSAIDQIPTDAREHAGLYLEAAALLGRRTGEMHLALATPTENQAFAAESFSAADLDSDAARISDQIVRSLDALKRNFTALPDEYTTESAALLLAGRRELFSRAAAITQPLEDGSGNERSVESQSGLRTRIHGDYHLGQVLRTRGDYVILDFEGEPARPLRDRRAKQSPLRDVAGMLRSFSYAAYSALDPFAQRHTAAQGSLEMWAQLWQNAVSTEFLNAWRSTVSANPHLTPQPKQAHRLLTAYVLEKALYELLYELNNRPTWVRIPLAGILALPSL